MKISNGINKHTMMSYRRILPPNCSCEVWLMVSLFTQDCSNYVENVFKGGFKHRPCKYNSYWVFWDLTADTLWRQCHTSIRYVVHWPKKRRNASACFLKYHLHHWLVCSPLVADIRSAIELFFRENPNCQFTTQSEMWKKTSSLYVTSSRRVDNRTILDKFSAF